MSFNKKRQFDSDSDGESSQVVKKSRPSKPAAKEVARITDEAGNSYWDVRCPLAPLLPASTVLLN